TAESEFQEGNYDDRRKMKDNSKKDLEELVEKMEELTVHTTWMMYNFIAIRTNPNLTNSIQRLEDTFLRCKKTMEKKCQKVPRE
ncbi:SYCE3 protein, partial [Pteruthius melanotis]|nr:SYCE3 protein [Pteruthius melanotis]